MHSRNRIVGDYTVPLDTMDNTVDVVNKPPHYNTSGLECIDAMAAMVEDSDVSAHIAYCWQNSFKYLWRWPYKNGLEDLKKARWYLDRIMKDMEGERE